MEIFCLKGNSLPIKRKYVTFIHKYTIRFRKKKGRNGIINHESISFMKEGLYFLFLFSYYTPSAKRYSWIYDLSQSSINSSQNFKKLFV